MITRLLPALKKHLEEATAHLHMVSPEKDKNGKPIVRSPKVFIGDFPAKREGGKDAREFPCILLTTVSGYGEGGEECVDIAAIAAVFNEENGDGEGLEMDLALLVSNISRALRKCLHTPLEERFALERDEKGRTYRYQRSGDPNQPRPFAQMTVISRWTAPGWE